MLIATANEAEGARHLRSLTYELRDIAGALADAEQAGICSVVTLPNATPEQVVHTFQSEACRDRIAIFHFAGHAGPEGLLFETGAGSTAVADAGGLAAFLGCQRGLQLVVLNACATQAHVDELREAGVGAVIATSKTVEDAIAHQFAVLLYQGLGSGAGIRRAYDEAAAGVRFKHGAAARGATAESMHASAEAVSRDIVRRNAPAATDDGRWPWDIYFRRGAEEAVGPWALPEAAGNPLFGLPTLPESEKPLDTPYRHLRPFAREHAELFFGRGKDIRELYDKVTSSESEPLVLMYGATGVGKSSLLDAGLLPRLTSAYEVRYAPRDRTLGLLGTLARALGVEVGTEPDASAIGTAWRALEESCGRPLFVVVDQLEEAYTSEEAGHVAPGHATRELDLLARAIATLFASGATRPQGRLVLGFRKEWLSEVKAALEAHRVPRTEHRLEQLTRSGVLEAITGPTRLPRRRMPTPFELEPGLDVLIADDLLANRASHVAPLLQILLAEMWTEAPRRDGAVRFDSALYETVRSRAKQLDEFLTQQLGVLREWHASAVDSGLALDFLRFYTTPKGTSDEHTASEERAQYPQAGDPAPGLRAMCARLFLLVERKLDDTGVAITDPPARLAHDTLAAIVRERFDGADAPGPRARRILEGRSAEWTNGQTGVPLDAQDLGIVESGERGMRRWNDAEQALVAASRVARDRARRRRAWVIRGAIAAVTMITGFGIGSWLLYRQSEERLAQSDSREIAARAVGMGDERRDVALLSALSAYERAPTFEARRALFTQLAVNPRLVRVLQTGASEVAFTPDGRALVLNAIDSIVVLDIETARVVSAVPMARYWNDFPWQMDPGGGTFSAVASRDSVTRTARIGIWEIPSQRQVGEFPMDSRDGTLTWLVAPLRADGVRLAATVESTTVVIWDVGARREVHRLRGHRTPPRLTGFSRDASLLVTNSDDGRAVTWDVRAGTRLRTTTVPPDRILNVAMTRSNDAVIAAVYDSLQFWTLSGDSELRLVEDVEASLVALSSDDSLLALASRGGRVQLLDFPPSGGMTTLQAGGDVAGALAFAPAGRRLAAISANGLVHVWDLATPGLIETSTVPRESEHQMVSVASSGRHLLLASDSAITLRDLATGARVGGIPGASLERSPRDRDSFLAWIGVSSTGARLIAPGRSAAGAPMFAVYDLAAGRVSATREFAVPDNGMAVMDPSGKWAAYGIPGQPKLVIVSLDDVGRVDTLTPGARPVALTPTSVPNFAFSPEGDVLAVEWGGRDIFLLDPATGAVRDSLSSDGSASRIIVGRGGQVIANAGSDEVVFWRAGSYVPFARLPGNGEPFHTVALSPDGSLFASFTYREVMSTHGEVMLVDVARGEPLGTIRVDLTGDIVLAFSDDGRRLLVAGAGGRIARIVTDPEEWAARACAIAHSDAGVARWQQGSPARARMPAACSRGRIADR